MSQLSAFLYNEAESDAYFDRQQRLGRIHLAVMRDAEPIGEVILKNIDRQGRHCTLSIHLMNDSVKNQGYGTKAEMLDARYAFEDLEMETMFADVLIKNTRSQRVLEKAGFKQTHQDGSFCFYCCKKI